MSNIINNIDNYGKKVPTFFDPISGNYDTYTIGKDCENFDTSFETYVQEQVDNFSQTGIIPERVIQWDYLNTSFWEELDMDIDSFYEEITNNRSVVESRKQRKFEEWIRKTGYWKKEHSLKKGKNVLDPLMKELEQWLDQLVDIIDQLRAKDQILWKAKVSELEELARKHLKIGKDTEWDIEDMPFDERI